MLGDPLVTRRGLLRAGLVGSAVVWAGGQIGCATRRSPTPVPRPQRVALTSTGEEILRRVAPVVLGSLLPADPVARERALDGGFVRLDDYLSYLSLPLQNEARDVFETLDLLPTRIVLLGTWSHWSDASEETLEAFLISARTSRFDLVRRVFTLLQSLVVLAWFDQPEAWPAIGYPGPPIERPLPGEMSA